MKTETRVVCDHRKPMSQYRCTKRAGHSGIHGEHRTEGGGFAATWENERTDVLAEPCDHARRSCEEIGCPGFTPDAPVGVEVNPALLQNATLPERMRAAAEVLHEASRRYDREHGTVKTDFALTSWDAANLRIVADRWELVDRKNAEEGLLATALLDAGWIGVTITDARKLINDGWTKGEKA